MLRLPPDGIRWASIIGLLLPLASGALGQARPATLGTAPAPLEPRLVQGLGDGHRWALPASPSAMVPLHGGIVYAAGRDLFWSDGTSAGTRLLATLCGLGCTRIVALGHGADLAFFAELIVQYDGLTTERVVRTDGTAAGTFAVSGLLTLGYPQFYGCQPAAAVTESRLFFLSGGTGYCQPWTSNGSPDGAVAVDPQDRVDSALVALGEDVYFLGASGTTEGLFRIDGRAIRVELVRAFDFPDAGVAANLVAAGGRLFFFGRHQLWTSDGSAAGTRALTRFASGTGARDLLAEVGGRAWFVADDGSGEELWSSDGSAGGTTRATDLLDPRPFRGSPLTADRLAWIGGRLVFPALDDGRARLWSTNGKWGSMRRVQGSPVVAPGRLALVDRRRAVFVAMRGGAPSELWVTNGFAAGTVRLLSGARFEQLAAVHDGVLFVERDGNRAFVGATDGTFAGTVGRLAAADPTGDLATASVSLGAWAHFPALDTLGRGGALWAVTPGAPAAHQVFLPPPHAAQPLDVLRYEDDYALELLGRAGGRVVAWRSDRGLYATDGVAVARLLDEADLEYSPDDVTASPAGDGVLMLTTQESDALGDKHELWGTDGSPEGTFRVPISPYAAVLGPVALAGRAIFAVRDLGVAGLWQLWRSDATLSGTDTEAAIPGDFFKTETSLTADASRACFLLQSGAPTYDRQLWCSDGTAGGTYALGPRLSPPRFQFVTGLAVTPAGVTLCNHRGGFDADRQTSLFTIDATGTLTEIRHEKLEGGRCRGFATGAAGRSWFYVEKGGAASLWATDGTQEGTVRLAAVPAPGSAPIAFGGGVFFLTRDARAGLQLWRSDGTDAGTGPLVRVAPGDQSLAGTRLLTVGGRLWFVGFDREHGLELWSSDGSSAGTRRETDLAPGAASSGMKSLVAVGDRLYFLADDTTRSGVWWVDLH